MADAKIPNATPGLIPYLVVNDSAKAIALYTKAFGAKEVKRIMTPDGKRIMHACVMIEGMPVFFSDADPQKNSGKTTESRFYLGLKDVDATFKQARGAGMDEVLPVQDMFWGDRVGALRDAFGNIWMVATHVRDVSPEEMEEAVRKMKNKAA